MNDTAKMRQELYKMAALLGDIQAIQKGPEAMLKRMLRKNTTKASSRLTAKMFK